MKEACSFLILGSGETQIEWQLQQMNQQFGNNYHAVIGYNEALSHTMYAGADFLLMPSRVEPCGLNQMYALRYGTIPIVRSIGGLKDTVIDISEEGGFGICHENVTVSEIVHAIARGLDLYNNQTQFKKIRKQIMSIDNSWDASAKEYIKLYKSLKG